jgi:hypothetical protein
MNVKAIHRQTAHLARALREAAAESAPAPNRKETAERKADPIRKLIQELRHLTPKQCRQARPKCRSKPPAWRQSSAAPSGDSGRVITDA